MQASDRLLCFDLDGTLIDSAPDLSFALGNALAAVGLREPTETQTRSWIGDGLDNLLRRALDDAGANIDDTFSAALESFHDCYANNLFVRSRLYPDTESALQSLLDMGLRICCITNKRTDYAVALLEQAGLERFFEFTFGGDSFASRKPDPQQLLEASRRTGIDIDQCIMIGDSDTDSRAAAAAGFAFVWAAFGYCRELQSRNMETVVRANRFADIPQSLAAITAVT